MRNRTPATPDTGRAAAPAAKKTDTRRRRFLLALGAGGAGAATAAVAAAPAALALPDKSAPDAKTAGYRETEHVRNYYRTARM
ncbi:MAG: formate dehydrogenase [Burkholderiales bacterium]